MPFDNNIYRCFYINDLEFFLTRSLSDLFRVVSRYKLLVCVSVGKNCFYSQGFTYLLNGWWKTHHVLWINSKKIIFIVRYFITVTPSSLTMYIDCFSGRILTVTLRTARTCDIWMFIKALLVIWLYDNWFLARMNISKYKTRWKIYNGKGGEK